MKIDAIGLQSFIAIATRLNFGRAAAELHVTQTALSAVCRPWRSIWV